MSRTPCPRHFVLIFCWTTSLALFLACSEIFCQNQSLCFYKIVFVKKRKLFLCLCWILLSYINLYSKASRKLYQQFTKRKLKFRGKWASCGFNYKETQVLLTVLKLVDKMDLPKPVSALQSKKIYFYIAVRFRH